MTDCPLSEEPCETGRNGKLIARIWRPKASPAVGCLVVVHGLGEHGDRYRPLAAEAASIGWATLCADLIGHGKSPGRRGHAPSYFALLEDIHAMRATASKTCPGAPQVLLGHSMGGNLAANYVLRRNELASPGEPPAGLVLSAPMFLPANPPNRTEVLAAWLTGYVVPWLTIRAPVDTSKLTTNPETVQALRDDPLVHRRLSIYLATQLLAQGRYALDHAHELTIPTLILHGKADPITSYRASESFALRSGANVHVEIFADMLHEIFHETNSKIVFDALRKWLNELIKYQPTFE